MQRPLSLGALWTLLSFYTCLEEWWTFDKSSHPLVSNGPARGIRLGDVVFHRARSKISRVDNLASASRRLRCALISDMSLLGDRSPWVGFLRQLPCSWFCDITPNGRGKDGLPDFPEIQKVEILEGDNPFGVHLYYPKEGDQRFDAPLPSAKEMHPTLELFDETKGISGGFRDVRIDDQGREPAKSADAAD